MRLRSGVEVRSTLSLELGQENMDSDTQSTDAQRGEDSQGGSFSASDLQPPLSPRSDKTVSPTRVDTRRQHAADAQQPGRNDSDDHRSSSHYIQPTNRSRGADLTLLRHPQPLSQSQNQRLYQTPQHQNRPLAPKSSHDPTLPLKRYQSEDEDGPWSAISPGAADTEKPKRKFLEVDLGGLKPGQSQKDQGYKDKLGTELDELEKGQREEVKGEEGSSRGAKRMRSSRKTSGRGDDDDSSNDSRYSR
ncbi:hypothetical protein BGZ60DRAFT_249474 [Tricladium varicosporioides]|nr:hypothetical protein BGZ60DRAFT_249474 [Hymenoscyphus varicosporioides]